MDLSRRIRFTNLGKILYPAEGYTKKDVIEYYIRVAPRILSFLKERALVMNRYPNGVSAEGFYEKDAPKGTPGWVSIHSRWSPSAGRETRYVVCDDIDTLLWLANLAALELHIHFWRMGSEKPDILVFDLDPEPPAGLNEAVETAIALKGLLGDLGLRCYVKSSGLKGLHACVPLEPLYTFNQTREYVHRIGMALAKGSDFIVSERSQTGVPGTVLVDYVQNTVMGTMAAPYSLRTNPRATVSTPLEWGELEGLRAEDWNLKTVQGRGKTPWKDFWENTQRLEPK